ncbi:MAG: alpha/beta hydrolase [Acidobacteria bacterium]|nr:alpha/beta hydrolase [Acidobacteriota bacterium]MCA1637126.1 alpha/beta hydrolase [Acidobacteriota bacterium]
MKFILVLLLFPILFGKAFGQNAQPVKITAGGVEFHYIEKGQGEPLVLLHGGVSDYRLWDAQIEEFSRNYRVISYSRRFHYPNKNSLDAEYRGAETDAEDLLSFLRKLKLKRVHLVGLSYGALTALIFALKHPGMVRSMVLAEPPAHQLIRDLPGGETVYQDFINALKPSVEAFKKGKDKEALRIFFAALGRKLDSQPPAAIEAVMQNAQAIKAINTSPEPFPKISKEKLRRLKIPVLIITGENTVKIHKLVDEELARLLPNAKEFVIPNAGHGTPRENPQVFNETVLKFLATAAHKTSKIKTANTQAKPATDNF